MKNKPGALFELLRPFHDAGIMLTRIETRPSRELTWTYLFFIDFEGHHDDDKVIEVMGKVEELAVNVKRLGSYPKAIL